ncbi:xylosidase/arabinosidase [Oleiharenicola lentus]|uniref:Xylosidase/arabinosidase n=1 Tax=Oleiharenicola lentus TaxID=2508720 RepID=A0A4Q1CA53_9BACT|nr:glycoside hydrolase family 71/99-like protein [Oleiharenicola lentus]RXK55943.1 xylosidase/arabinosidase [Oleiharenicola lentus]
MTTLSLPRLLAASTLLAVLFTSCAGPGTKPVNSSSLTGKVMVGYQGWFNAEGDGSGRGYNHWTRDGKQPAPDNVRVDLWPDLSEFPASERFPTKLRHADGTPAEVFSSYRRPTVVRHFAWMEEHGIDGVFLQRFVSSLARGTSLAANNAVLENVRAGARAHGRVYALMYDLSGLRPGHADVLIDDWKKLLRDTRLTSDPNYLHHRGKPLLALWGCGFLDHDKPRPTLEDWRKILTFLKEDKTSGGLAIMLGVPSQWRTLTRDSVPDPMLHELIALADVVSPWTPGRYRTPEAATTHAATVWQPDIAWLRERQIDFLPVAFPGFSWHNMKDAPLDDIPRLQGRFFWSQIAAAKDAGASMLYVAMFDEVDEGTAIFKVTNTPPVGNGAKFVTYEGLRSDHYLRLTGLAGKVIRGELPPTAEPPLPVTTATTP